MIGASRKHLGEVGEGYVEHLRFATRVGALAIGGGLACLAHALVPGLFQTTGSRAIRRLNQLIDERARPENCAERSPSSPSDAALLRASGDPPPAGRPTPADGPARRRGSRGTRRRPRDEGRT